jgi:Methyltransferase domain/Putative zinc binding domain/C-methyltransferase C-terminal domain
MSLKEITSCEVCGNTHLTLVMDLGALPIPDDLVPIGEVRACEKYPTEILFCDVCKTAHQHWEIPKQKVFHQDYHYRAANTKDVLMGLEQLVSSIERYHGPVAGLTVLDVGCNDGCLLDVFRARGATTFGIEPTKAAYDANGKGHQVFKMFLTEDAARECRLDNIKPDIITFTNVFAHICDLADLIRAVNIIRAPHTKVIIENHYLGSVLDRKQFDTFYHEHLRTYSYTSFLYIARTMGMSVNWVEFPKRYGGNIRVSLVPVVGQHSSTGPNENDFETRLFKLDKQVKEWKAKKSVQLMNEIAFDHIWSPIPAAALPGRATMLFTLLGFDKQHISGVYEVPISKKIGHYVPGTHIPILSDDIFPWDMYRGPVLNTAWHIADEIEQRWRSKGFKGRIIQAIDNSDFA